MSTTKTTYTEQTLLQLLTEKKAAEPGTIYVSCGERAFGGSGPTKIRVDLCVRGKTGITLYEAKAGDSKVEHLHQLLMRCTGCLANGEPVQSVILIADHHPEEVRLLASELNRQKGPGGESYHIELSTWANEGITLPSASV